MRITRETPDPISQMPVEKPVENNVKIFVKTLWNRVWKTLVHYPTCVSQIDPQKNVIIFHQ